MTAPTPFWTPEFLAFVMPLVPEQVLVGSGQTRDAVMPASRREWQWIQLAQRLAWTLGPERAVARLNELWTGGLRA
jgi:hypothetical protein